MVSKLFSLLNYCLVLCFKFFEELPVSLGFYKTVTKSEVPKVFERHSRKTNFYFEIDSSDRLGSYKKYIKRDSPNVCVASKDDGEEFCAIANTSYRARKSYGRDRILIEDFNRCIERRDVPMFFLNDEGEKIGTGMYWLRENGSSEFGCLAILPKYQSKGWMKKIFIQLMESWCSPGASSGSSWGCYFISTCLLGKAFVNILGKRWECNKIPNICVSNHQNLEEIFFIYCLYPSASIKPKEDPKKIEPDMSRIIETVLSFFKFPKSSQVSLVSFFLGIVFLVGIWVFWSCENLFNFGLVLISFSMWNFTEFIFYDYFNQEISSVNSFALDSKNYLVGMMIYYTEFFLELYFFPNLSNSQSSKFLIYFGFICSVVMLIFQIFSKITLGSSFTYYVAAADEKRTKREYFVDYGVFKYLRHPRYFGFFYWTISLSFIALNPFCVLLQSMMMISFYSKRIKEEESVLLKVFGKKYEQYVQKVGVYIPFTAPKYTFINDKDGKKRIKED